MHFSKSFLKAISASADRSDDPLGIMWPMPGNPTTWLSFVTFDAWQQFVAEYQLRHDAPQIVKDKFTRNTELAQWLRLTGDQELIEGNYWHDTFWGICDNKGENNLGKILMRVRTELKEKE